MIRRQALGLVLSALLVGGCAIFPRSDRPQGLEGVPPQSEIATVPFHPQEEYQCGPAALAMALAWSGLKVTPAELKAKVYTAALQGSLQPAMVAGARRFGRLAYVISGTAALIREIAAGHPVIVLQNLGLAWAPVWHYAVVIGYDIPADEIVLHSGRDARKRISLGIFQTTWERSENWGLLVLEPDRFPATATEAKFIDAVLGLEKAKQPAAAAKGYGTALSRWPDNLPAAIGLGYNYYALGELQKSENAFQEAVHRHPESGAAWNNLAHVRLALGRHAEAIEAVQRAIALGGPPEVVEVFQKTLREIEAAAP